MTKRAGDAGSKVGNTRSAVAMLRAALDLLQSLPSLVLVNLHAKAA
jgi:hypothetical protein